MLLQMREELKIENPRQYAAQVVEDLRELLKAGGEAQSDPHRDNFYQLGDDRNTYYVHVSPLTGNVILLAKWSREHQPCYANVGSLSA